jgi:hypothetical protein
MGVVEKKQSEVDAIGQLSWGATTVQAKVGCNLLPAIISQRAQAMRCEASVQSSDICLIVILLSFCICWLKVGYLRTRDFSLGPSICFQKLLQGLAIFLR